MFCVQDLSFSYDSILPKGGELSMCHLLLFQPFESSVKLRNCSGFRWGSLPGAVEVFSGLSESEEKKKAHKTSCSVCF